MGSIITRAKLGSNLGQVVHSYVPLSPSSKLPVHRDQLRAQRSVTSMGELYRRMSSIKLTLSSDKSPVELKATFVHRTTGLEVNLDYVTW